MLKNGEPTRKVIKETEMTLNTGGTNGKTTEKTDFKRQKTTAETKGEEKV